MEWVRNLIIEDNDHITLSVKDGKVFLFTKREGYSLKKFEEYPRKNPRFKITSFMTLKKALSGKSTEPIEIGNWIDLVELDVSLDYMQALITVNESTSYIEENIIEVQSQIHIALEKNNITYGKKNIDILSLKPGKPFIIAQGTPPQKGLDAQVSYLAQAEKKPVINEDGKADYFDMNFLKEIHEGSWLGEKIPAKEGVDGTNLYGETVKAAPGDDITLKYDPKTAYEIEEGGKIVLRSKTKGVIGEVNGVLSVLKHLVVDGDVGIETGNLKFDGSIQVKGTVMAGYSVIASGDVSIEGKDGVNSAELIKSAEGDVFIKGGIFGRGVTKVEAHNNIYLKHANECTLDAKENIHIGFYALGVSMFANEIILDERKGKIIGGKAVAVHSITTAYSSNSMERKTELIVQGIDRKILTENAKMLAEKIVQYQEESTKLNYQISQLGQFKGKMTTQQNGMYEQVKQKYNLLQQEMKEADKEIQRILRMLRSKAEYYVNVTKEANPGTYIQIGNKSTFVASTTKGKFKLENGELNV